MFGFLLRLFGSSQAPASPAGAIGAIDVIISEEFSHESWSEGYSYTNTACEFEYCDLSAGFYHIDIQISFNEKVLLGGFDD